MLKKALKAMILFSQLHILARLRHYYVHTTFRSSILNMFMHKIHAYSLEKVFHSFLYKYFTKNKKYPNYDDNDEIASTIFFIPHHVENSRRRLQKFSIKKFALVFESFPKKKTHHTTFLQWCWLLHFSLYAFFTFFMRIEKVYFLSFSHF